MREMMNKAAVITALFFCLMLPSRQFVFSACASRNYEDETSGEALKNKKSHKWLIAVGAAAGFTAGLLIGLNAFDDAINSTEKVWTTTAISAGAGGIVGWLGARHLDKPAEMSSTLKLSQNPEVKLETSFNSTCSHKKSFLLEKVDCMYPNLLPESMTD
jgi:hypothetical protein